MVKLAASSFLNRDCRVQLPANPVPAKGNKLAIRLAGLTKGSIVIKSYLWTNAGFLWIGNYSNLQEALGQAFIEGYNIAMIACWATNPMERVF